MGNGDETSRMLEDDGAECATHGYATTREHDATQRDDSLPNGRRVYVRMRRR